ncbi:MAG: hypothetical protein E5Y12_24840 [Mesorhizobium sp.]|nr:MAG: hypothetical protein E5Y12_24840 [Mesorhizobium sp.]
MTYAKGKAVGGDIHRSDGAVLGVERFGRRRFMWLETRETPTARAADDDEGEATEETPCPN